MVKAEAVAPAPPVRRPFSTPLPRFSQRQELPVAGIAMTGRNAQLTVIPTLAPQRNRKRHRRPVRLHRGHRRLEAEASGSLTEEHTVP
ncbi:hypothetical protein MTO96_001936 [Rhipicephalus appendiculatus]